jgi:hypothetical protein
VNDVARWLDGGATPERDQGPHTRTSSAPLPRRVELRFEPAGDGPRERCVPHFVSRYPRKRATQVDIARV